MRVLFAMLTMALFAFAATSLLPWWSLSIVCFIVAAGFRLSAGASFISGFLAVFLMWLVVNLVKDQANGQILSTRMAELFGLKGPYLFILVSSLAGAVVGGMAAWSGSLARRTMRNH